MAVNPLEEYPSGHYEGYDDPTGTEPALDFEQRRQSFGLSMWNQERIQALEDAGEAE